jgi:alpha-L-fucosidase 2
MRGAAAFCLAWLIEDGKGHLTTCPSESTENNFIAPDGKPAMTSAGCTMDMALTRELFANCSAASKELGIDADFAAKLDAAAARLIPYQIGRYGQLQEWSVDFEDTGASVTCPTCPPTRNQISRAHARTRAAASPRTPSTIGAYTDGAAWAIAF